ncbi:cryptochrome/photolyase family protein [Rubrivivax benzoatilyticus]|uniref:Cryptochrome/photolyase family protein n=1 Tax=Rubrivivax benzoatilyticus TaxID=316997 RepID=A0ABX0HWK3_9BURK|nr:cryptochrome/photolyase family protein [Rubrivivax benzoatilyticus]EGJ09427.1 deoxyribodipyrimidine photolyase-related protein [Rubrivivax benzoatilyticus JA2 = ATCC BAA-35]NHK98740.1 cryptochrome/photolyase family protein [Rubrivivax benzoatilyticus]NHL24242.1 cryptochrome/photolyase family protein [Rubrivivax benzoatilyticus]
MRHLVLVLGDQLDAEAAAFDGFDTEHDAVWMAEVDEESTHVPSSQPRTALFLAAMRHFAAALQAAGRRVHYTRLDDAGNRGRLADELDATIERLQPQALVMTAPGDHRVLRALQAVAASHGLPLELRPDRHFFCTVREFAAHARSRRTLRLEFFYREQRRRHGVLMDGGEPCGGRWNYDADNREAFGRDGPPPHAEPPRFAPDAMTREVLDLVRRRFAGHPGRLDSFAWPVTREQALHALQRFVAERLAGFGRWQDALWPGEPWLWHSQLSAALNLKLLDPHEVVAAAEAAYRAGRVPLESAEGFIRQILGWREYVRGVYWTRMPGYAELNAWDAHEPLPAFYWSGDTPMACLADAIVQTLEHGYAYHIQRLMVTGLYALLLGVEPKEVHAWYLAVYVDAVEWVELPNTLGMSQNADGGLMASKPYVASGRYIERMSAGRLCAGCRFRPGERTGDTACPFTTLYWDFLLRHEARLATNPRMVMPLKHLTRLDAAERARIGERAAALRAGGF